MYIVFWLFPICTSNRISSYLCYSDTKKTINETPVFLYNPASSDTSDWTVLSWNPVSCETTNSDHFLIPDYPESHRNRTDAEIGSDRFRLYESDRNLVNPVSGYQRKTVDSIGIRQKVTDRIRLAVWQRIKYPPDRIRCTHFDLGCFLSSLYMISYFGIFRISFVIVKIWLCKDMIK